MENRLQRDDYRRLTMLWLLAAALGFMAVFVFQKDRQEPIPAIYAYDQAKASNGVLLHTIRTSPDHIYLRAIDSNLAKRKEYGINGGFFWEGYLLSMAIMNDQPAKGKPGDYGSGWFNTDRRKGTLVWDASAGKFSVQVAEAAEELIVADRKRYWAQGGVSMSLSNESAWSRQAVEEDMPALNEKRMRSGMIYDSSNQVWLIVSPTPCTVEEFRNAAKERVNRVAIAIDGIFLDGDGSSQMKIGRTLLSGDGREVYQMITLVR